MKNISIIMVLLTACTQSPESKSLASNTSTEPVKEESGKVDSMEMKTDSLVKRDSGKPLLNHQKLEEDHFESKKPVPKPVAEVDNEQIGPLEPESGKKNPPTIRKTVEKKDEYLRFYYERINHSIPGVADSRTERSLELLLPIGDATEFEITGSELKKVVFKYHVSGGMLWKNSMGLIKSGVIQGKKQNAEWTLLIDIVIHVQDSNSEELKEEQLELEETF